MTEKVTIELSESDLAELREWAKNSERDLENLLHEAVQTYLQRERAWVASVREAEQGPFYDLADVEAELRKRRDQRTQAAE
jgi:predicted transcriptional regulator